MVMWHFSWFLMRSAWSVLLLRFFLRISHSITVTYEFAMCEWENKNAFDPKWWQPKNRMCLLYSVKCRIWSQTTVILFTWRMHKRQQNAEKEKLFNRLMQRREKKLWFDVSANAHRVREPERERERETCSRAAVPLYCGISGDTMELNANTHQSNPIEIERMTYAVRNPIHMICDRREGKIVFRSFVFVNVSNGFYVCVCVSQFLHTAYAYHDELSKIQVTLKKNRITLNGKCVCRTIWFDKCDRYRLMRTLSFVWHTQKQLNVAVHPFEMNTFLTVHLQM